MAPTPKFYMVYGIGKDAPKCRHGSRDDADREAKRLARANVGVTFVVLQAVSAITKHEFEVIDLTHVNAVSCAYPSACTKPNCDCEIPF